MSEWEEFKECKKGQEVVEEEPTGETIPEGQRVELIKQDCKHERVILIKKRDDGLEDWYCEQCNHGFIVKSYKDIK